MAKFDLAISFVLDREGGFVDDPADRGGATNWGITQSTLAKWRKSPVSTDDVRQLPLSEAKAIYKAHYWDVLNCSQVVDQDLALLIFDQGVNRGVVGAARLVQKQVGVKVDGQMGPKTMAAINSIHAKHLIKGLINAAQDAYVDIVKRDPSQLRFLSGWINRTQHYFDLLA